MNKNQKNSKTTQTRKTATKVVKATKPTKVTSTKKSIVVAKTTKKATAKTAVKATAKATPVKTRNVWTIEDCKKAALKCKTRTQFSTRFVGQYFKAYRSGWLDKVCKHMG